MRRLLLAMATMAMVFVRDEAETLVVDVAFLGDPYL